MSNLQELQRRRGFLDVTADILRVAEQGARKTEIMYKANLSYDMLCNYLEVLTTCRLVFQNPPLYRTSKKGLEFLRNYQEFKHVEEIYQSKKHLLKKMLLELHREVPPAQYV